MHYLLILAVLVLLKWSYVQDITACPGHRNTSTFFHTAVSQIWFSASGMYISTILPARSSCGCVVTSTQHKNILLPTPGGQTVAAMTTPVSLLMPFSISYSLGASILGNRTACCSACTLLARAYHPCPPAKWHYHSMPTRPCLSIGYISDL